MANNRVWLEDTETGRRALLAKGGAEGWAAWCNESRLQEFFGHDLGTIVDIVGALGGKSTLRLVFEHGAEGD